MDRGTMALLMDEIPGFVWGFHFDPVSGAGRALPASASRSDVEAGEGFTWLHLALSDARVPGFLAGLRGLPAEARETLTDRDNHVTLAVSDGVLHGVFTDLERAFDYETRDVGWFRFAISERMIVTARLHPLRCIETARSAVERGVRLERPMDVFEAIVGEFVRTLDGLVVEMNEELDRIEDYVFEDAPRDERRRLGPVRRTVVRLHRQLRASIALLRRLQHEGEAEPPRGAVEAAERLVHDLQAVYQEIQALQDRARLLHEEIDSKISSETNRHLYIVSVMTAFLLPPTLVTGFFGMNTGDLPFHGAYGTLFAFGLGGASIALAWWLLRRMGIL